MIPPFEASKRKAFQHPGRSPQRRIAAARTAAFDILQQVEAGGYASDLLREITAPLESRDAALASQIVFGTLRYQAQLDWLIQLYAGRPADSLHEAVRLVLRSAIFQLRYLERIPPHAAVHEAVELTKTHRRAASGLVNAVLRKVNRDPVAWPDMATELSCPASLLERWGEHFGPEAAQQIARAALREPIPHIRVPEGSALPPGVQLEATAVPGAWRVTGGELRDLRLHDIGSQTVLPHLGLKPGDHYLDLCAAPGNKTRQALETPLGLAVACDISEVRLRGMTGCGQDTVCSRVVLDGTESLPFPPMSFDCIFIDAPCSGTGTMGRNPEIKWRVQPCDLPGFQRRQIALIRRAAAVVRPGGRLLYATCSLEREENEDVVAAACDSGSLTRIAEHWRLPGREEGDGFYSAVLQPQITL